jgi:hypothetical protein
MTNFVRTGGIVFAAASDYSLLPVDAVRRRDGSLTVLAINKDTVNTNTSRISVANFTPSARAGS